MGPAGTGKSVLSAQFICAAARRGTRSVVFVFDELRRTMIERADALGMDLSKHVAAGTVIVQQIDPAEMSPGELASRARELVETDQVDLVVIDSLNGYMQSMPAERYLYVQMHEMLTYFGQQGVTTVMLMAQSGIVGQIGTPADLELHRGLHRAAALLRGRRPRPQGDLGDQEALWPPRGHDPRAHDHRPGPTASAHRSSAFRAC